MRKGAMMLKIDKTKMWTGKIQLVTATSKGRTGLRNLAGINIKAYKMMLFGNLASGGIYETTS